MTAFLFVKMQLAMAQKNITAPTTMSAIAVLSSNPWSAAHENPTISSDPDTMTRNKPRKSNVFRSDAKEPPFGLLSLRLKMRSTNATAQVGLGCQIHHRASTHKLM